MADIPAILSAPSFDLDADGVIEFWEVSRHLGDLFAQYDLDGNGRLEGSEVTALSEEGFPLTKSANNLSYTRNEDGLAIASTAFAQRFWHKAGGASDYNEKLNRNEPAGGIAYDDWFKDFGAPTPKLHIMNA
jgi:hypothetical protein